MSSQVRLPGIARFLYNHNPFYLISAAFIVYTLKLAFRPGEVPYIDPWALMASIGGYTLLTALTGFLIVKLGHVWEDARSIFLVLLLLFLGTSVTFDELLNNDPVTGKKLIVSGFCLAVLVTEGLLAGLGIRLRAFFRVPYYLWLTLLYFFPLWVSPELTGLSASATSWRLLGFPVAAGVLTLSLLPAVRFGADYCKENGTPWSWPLFPWTLFIFMGLATLFRTYALTISFLPSDGMQTTFQPYFLTPFLFAVLVLLLEMGIVERQKTLVQVSLALSLIVAWLSVPGIQPDLTAATFLQELSTRIGSPLWLGLVSLIVFYAWALWRGIDSARWYLLGASIIATRIGPDSLSIEHFVAPQAWPLFLAGIVELGRGLRKREPVMLLSGSLCFSVALSAILWESPWFVYRRTLPYHAALASVLLIGCLFRTGMGRLIRITGAVLLPLSAAAALVIAGDQFLLHPSWPAYVLGLMAVAGICWITTRDTAFLYSLLFMISSACLAAIAGGAMWLIRRVGIQILLPLVLGVGSFLIGAAISIAKGMGFQRIGPSEPPTEPLGGSS